MNDLHMSATFCCDFCNSKFKDISTLNRHIKTNKKCLSVRPNKQVFCIWCNELFISNFHLERHLSKCNINKENSHILLLEKLKDKDKIIEDKDRQLTDKDKVIKDLQDKLYALANKPTTTNTVNTLNNVKLVCDKPLDFSVKTLYSRIKKHCNYDYVIQGEIGLTKLILKYGAVNENGKLSIQCTDKNRKIFKYINLEAETKQMSGNFMLERIKKALSKYKSSSKYKDIQNKIEEKIKEEQDLFKAVKCDEFFNPGKLLVNTIVNETYKTDDDSDDSDFDSSSDESGFDTDENKDDTHEGERVLHWRQPRQKMIRYSDMFYDFTPEISN